MDNIESALMRIADSLEKIAQSDMFRIPEAQIIEIGLLTEREYLNYKGRIPKCSVPWWIDTGKSVDNCCYVDMDGTTAKCSDEVEWIYIRPILRIQNGVEFNLNQQVHIGNHTFSYIGDDKLISVSAIEKTSYKRIKEKAPWEWENLIFGTWKFDKRLIKDVTIENTCEITLLSSTEFNRFRKDIPVIEMEWWTIGVDGSACYVDVPSNNVYSSEYTTQARGIRPVLIVNIKNFDLKVRDKVRINDRIYTYIGENYLLLDTVCAKSIFDRTEEKWNDSDLKRWLTTKGKSLLLGTKKN